MLNKFSDRGRRHAGFTLLEMIIVIAVLGMALGLVVTRGPMRSQTMEMQAVVNQVAQGLRVARSRAIADNAPVRFTVDIPLHSFGIERGGRSRCQGEHAIDRRRTKPLKAGWRHPVLPDGSATGETDRPGRRPAFVAHIGVDWLTGRVSVQTR
jgi:general secretion pathway protein H